MRKIKNLILILTLVLTFSCEHDDTAPTPVACEVENPAENLPWLKAMIESWEANGTLITYMYVQQGTYKGQTVFLPGSCCPFCDFFFRVYDCDGQEVTIENGQHVMDLKTIWKPQGSQCTF